MPRWFRSIATGLCFATFSVGTSFISWVILPVTGLRLIGKSPLDKTRGHQRVLLHCYYAFCQVMWFAGIRHRFRRPPLPAELPDGPFVLIANHPTLVDVLHILATVPGVTCLVHRRHFRSWIIGPLLRRGGHIEGPDPEAGVEGTSVLDAIVGRLEQGLPVLVFPEGTRSPAWGLRRFKRGAVEAAVRAEVPVIPLFIGCDPPTLLKGQPWYVVPSRRWDLTLEFLPVMNPVAMGGDSRSITAELKARYDQLVADAKERSQEKA